MLGDEFRPTLLVGVGGTGCVIAEEVYATALSMGANRGGKIAVIGIDTDENDMRRLSDLDKRQQIRFSSSETISRLITQLRDYLSGWFVDEETLPAEIRSMTLLDGAMQIRMLTQLALYDAVLRSQFVDKMERAVAQLGLLDSREVQSGGINIMMVGSLAGATGSGSFLQIALLLRDICQRRRLEGAIRAIFLLPDVFVRGANLPAEQIENIYANGYASIKELNAVNLKVTGRIDRGDFEYQFAPGYPLRRDAMPFNSVTFIDWENLTGGNLGRNIVYYRKMTARAVYLQLFSPIGQRLQSVTVNDARAKMAAAAAGSTEIYSGVGVSAVVYPAEGIKNYLSRQLALISLSGDWLRLDSLFIDRVRRYNDDKAAGNLSVRAPVRGLSYVEDLERLSKDRVLFFRDIFDKSNHEIEMKTGERELRPFHIDYLDSLLEKISFDFWDANDDLKAIAELLKKPLVDDNLKNTKTLAETTQRCERQLDRSLTILESALRTKPIDLFFNLQSAGESGSEAEWKIHNIQAHVIAGGPHLVQVRYFLYKALAELERRLAGLSVKVARDQLFKVANAFRRDPDEMESPTSRGAPEVLEEARNAVNPGLWKAMWAGDGGFRIKYTSYYNSSLRGLLAYVETSVRSTVLTALRDELESLTREVEGVFQTLADFRDRLAADVERLEAEHERGAGTFDGNVFVCATKICKKSLWKELSEATTGLGLSSQANRTLADAVYRIYRDKQRKKANKSAGELRDLLERAIFVDFAGRALANFVSFHDFSVIRAVQKEAEIEGGDWLDRLRHAVDVAGSQSEPFLPLLSRDAGQRIMFWAIHPDTRVDVGDDRQFDQLFTANQGESPLVLEEFSRQELLCMNTRVNLNLRELQKLYPGETRNGMAVMRPGIYYNAYKNMTDAIAAAELKDPRRPKSRYFTPHVHKDWHRPGAIPEIFAELDDNIRDKTYQSFVAGLAIGVLLKAMHYGKERTLVRTTGQAVPNPIERALCESHDDWEILNALSRRPELVSAVLEVWQATTKDAPQPSADRDAWFDALPAVTALLRDGHGLLRQLLAIGAIRTNEHERDADVRGAVKAFAILLAGLVDLYRGDLAVEGRRGVKTQLLETARDQAFAGLTGTAIRPETVTTLKTVFEGGLADFRGDHRYF